MDLKKGLRERMSSYLPILKHGLWRRKKSEMQMEREHARDLRPINMHMRYQAVRH